MAKKRKPLATVTHPSITAALDGLYRYSEEKRALEQLATLKRHFTISRQQPPEDSVLRLWIKGYSLTPEEREEGYRGHFALIHALKEGKHWTLRAEKNPAPLATHPERVRPKRTHPDWGHPLLREIQKNKTYETAEEAASILMALHEAFPEASIPGHGKLFLMIYERGRNPSTPVQKYIFKAVPSEEGQEEGNVQGKWQIQYIVNPKQRRQPRRRTLKTEDLPEGATPGFFAKMVRTKRK